MVVEDDPDIREAVQTILEEEGFEVITASNGAEAEAQLDVIEDPCLVILDMMMPVMSGWELLAHLKRDGKLRDGRLQVVVVSASPYQVPPGPVAIMRKPVRVEQLLKTVRRYC